LQATPARTNAVIPSFRVVPPERDRSVRRLLGYWTTLELAHDAALALFE